MVALQQVQLEDSAMKNLSARHFDQQRFTTKCLWLFLAMFTFLIFFYSGTLLMSIVYPLDEAMLGF
jgi:hypothetical protein